MNAIKGLDTNASLFFSHTDLSKVKIKLSVLDRLVCDASGRTVILRSTS